MKLLVKRYIFGEKATIGRLYVDDVFECYTLEDKVREVEGEPIESWKVYGQTAIPRGKYKIVIDYSQHFNCDLPRLVDVPGYSGVRIHPGNSDADTEGCILVGSTVVNDDYISNSRATFGKLFDALDLAYGQGEELELEVA